MEGDDDYIRLQRSEQDPNKWVMQTAVTTFQRTIRSTSRSNRAYPPPSTDMIELHAQIHFGERDYFDYYNNATTFTSHYDRIFYELLIDEHLLENEQEQQERRTKFGGDIFMTTTPNDDDNENYRCSNDTKVLKLDTDLMSSYNDQGIAKQYEWECQVDQINYKQKNWIHADFTRQQLLESLKQEQQREQQQKKKSSKKKNDSHSDTRPLWEQVTTATASTSSASSMWEPAVSALFVGPATTTTGTAGNTNSLLLYYYNNRRLFSNLFLPGNSLAYLLRMVLWLTIPSPEISILLLDWSCIFQSSSIASTRRKKKNKNSIDNDYSTTSSSSFITGLINKVTTPILQSLITGSIKELRQLIFGEVLVAGQQEQQQQPGFSLLITKRNDFALNVVQSFLDSKNNKTNNREASSSSATSRNSKSALLYGCSHCPDLQSKLIQNHGFIPIKKEWRTAWSINVPSTISLSSSTSSVSEKMNNNDNSNSNHKNNNNIQESSQKPVAATPAAFSVETIIAAVLVVVPVYLAIGGADYIGNLDDIVLSLEHNNILEAMGIFILYIARHVGLYVGLSKFILDLK